MKPLQTPTTRRPSNSDESGRGLLVTLDGPSGVGKSTVSVLLAERFAALAPVLHTTQPSDSEIGKLARHGTFDYHGLPLALLVAADRYLHTTTVIEPAIAAGTIVVCDRYLLSSLVLEQLDGVDADFITDLYRHLPLPDFAFVLHDEPERCRERAAARGGYSRFHQNDPATAATEGEMFTALAETLAAHGYPVRRVKVAGRSAAAVAEEIHAEVETSWATSHPRR
ncbi:dTMP kinase [Catenulispora yoronensis]|uniref:dTMP kinase n=1 Tax=Catenulispora yoronensis TaxID=450799 RepID=UPI0031E29376